MRLSRTGGVPVPRDAFREEVLPPHLRMNFLLVDDAQKVIARSRSLRGLRDRHAGASQQDYAKQSQPHHRRSRLGVSAICPTSSMRCRANASRWVIPALVDEGETVGLRVFATPPEARMSHERGTARLIKLVMAREFKSLRRDLAVNVQG